MTVLWRVTPDYGELDANVVGREKDIDNGKKFSGWTDPMSWADDGADDEKVLLQTRDDEDEVDALALNGCHESGFITPADIGLGDEEVML